jgi:signal transduction histidine kinase
MLLRDRGTVGAHVLLDATNRFLVTTDLDGLATAIALAAGAIFESERVDVVFAGAAAHLDDRAVEPRDEPHVGRIGSLLTVADGFVHGEVGGHEQWAGDGEVGAPGDADEFGPAGELRAALARDGCAAGFVVPIRSGGLAAGALFVAYPQPRSFDDEIREVARHLAVQAGLAHELLRARTDVRAGEAALARQVRRTEALLEVSQKLAAIVDPEVVLSTIAPAVTEATGVSIAFIARWDAESRSAIPVASSGLTPAQTRLSDRVHPTPERWAIVERALSGSIEVIRRPVNPADFPVELFERWGLEAAALAPILIETRTWGFIALGAMPGDEWAGEAIPELLGGLSGIAATAIARAEAVAALEREADLLEFHVAERTHELGQAVNELRVASRAKTEFLANVSHELRTPLTVIVGFSEVLVRGIDGPLTPDQLADSRTINAASRHLLELIDDLIDIQQIEEDRIVLRTERIELKQFLISALEDVRPHADARGLSLELVDNGMPETVDADRARFSQIVRNLLSNAVKFTGQGGCVWIVAAADGLGHVRIEVEDTGVGIAPEDQARIFEKFQRVASDEFSGTGLGLSIARRLARMHGGELSVRSILGSGSRFTLVLPIRDADRGG